MVTKWDFLEMKTSLWLEGGLKIRMSLEVDCLPYAVWKQRPYSGSILEENGHEDDDDSDDDYIIIHHETDNKLRYFN